MNDPREMQALAESLRAAGRRIAFVPTMGALHEGHLALLDEARRRADFTVVSIFVNPSQFGPGEDFSQYPRTLDADLAACRTRGADCVFAPSAAAFYAPDFSTFVNEEMCSRGLCGDFRPGHFRGVATVVLMLFNIVRPHSAIFGAKDAQQCAVIRKMVSDLFVPVEIVIAETRRESDGLAMSSRNRRLSPKDREKAPALARALFSVRDRAAAGERDAAELTRIFRETLAGEPALGLEYFSICDARTMAAVSAITPGETLAAAAARLGGTRLIDNIRL